MYLDFIIDIAEVGNKVVLKTNAETVEGLIVKVSKDLIAIRKTDGSIILKKDSDILNIEIQTAGIKDAKVEQLDTPKNNERSGMVLIKKDKVESFLCSMCGKLKTSKKYAVKACDSDYKICNSCYGWTLSKIENK